MLLITIFVAVSLVSCSTLFPGLFPAGELEEDSGDGETMTEPAEAVPEKAEAPDPPAEAAPEQQGAEAPEPTADEPEKTEEQKIVFPEGPLSAMPEPEPWFEMTAGLSHRALGTIDLQLFVRQLESDRRLLVEIRKEVPEDRTETEIYLARLKELASLSDPVRLVPIVNRVLDQTATYLTWLETEFEDENEQVQEYYVGGARAFHFALEEFKGAAMFTIINRLDIAAKVIRELEAETRRIYADEESR